VRGAHGPGGPLNLALPHPWRTDHTGTGLPHSSPSTGVPLEKVELGCFQQAPGVGRKASPRGGGAAADASRHLRHLVEADSGRLLKAPLPPSSPSTWVALGTPRTLPGALMRWDMSASAALSSQRSTHLPHAHCLPPSCTRPDRVLSRMHEKFVVREPGACLRSVGNAWVPRSDGCAVLPSVSSDAFIARDAIARMAPLPRRLPSFARSEARNGQVVARNAHHSWPSSLFQVPCRRYAQALLALRSGLGPGRKGVPMHL